MTLKPARSLFAASWFVAMLSYFSLTTTWADLGSVHELKAGDEKMIYKDRLT